MTKYALANRVSSRKSTIGCKTSIKETIELVSGDITEVLSTLDLIYKKYKNIENMPEELYDISIELRQHIMDYVKIATENKAPSIKKALMLIKEDSE